MEVLDEMKGDMKDENYRKLSNLLMSIHNEKKDDLTLVDLSVTYVVYNKSEGEYIRFPMEMEIYIPPGDFYQIKPGLIYICGGVPKNIPTLDIITNTCIELIKFDGDAPSLDGNETFSGLLVVNKIMIV